MKTEEVKRGIPVGKAKKLEVQTETLPFVEVENEVVWENPNLNIPFKLEVGKPTNLGLFLSPEVKSFKKTQKLGVEIGHGRSALLGRVIISDKFSGETYRDIDTKGGGYLKTNYDGGSFMKKVVAGRVEKKKGMFSQQNMD